MRIKLLTLLLILINAHAQQARFWEFPNFSDRVQIEVANKLDLPYDGVAVLPLSAIQAIAPGFPGSLLLATDDSAPARSIEAETNFSRKDISFAVHLEAKQAKTIVVYYSQTLHATTHSVSEVFAEHSYGYNRSTVALESKRIGYRSYGAFMLDVQAHSKNEHGLFNARIGYASISHPLREGRDVVHLGDTLGLGGLFLRSSNDVYRPPFSTPDYTHRAPRPNEPTYRVISSGPLRAIVEEDLARWHIGADTVAVRMQYEIDAEQEVVHCHWWLTPLHVSRTYGVGAGIRDLDPQNVREVSGALVTAGTQPDSDGPIALGLGYGSGASRAGELPTPKANNQIVLFSGRLSPNTAAEGEYTLAAAWAGSGWADPGAHVLDLLRAQAAMPETHVIGHERTPHPRALESEPQ